MSNNFATPVSALKCCQHIVAVVDYITPRTQRDREIMHKNSFGTGIILGGEQREREFVAKMFFLSDFIPRTQRIRGIISRLSVLANFRSVQTSNSGEIIPKISLLNGFISAQELRKFYADFIHPKDIEIDYANSCLSYWCHITQKTQRLYQKMFFPASLILPKELGIYQNSALLSAATCSGLRLDPSPG